MNGYFDWPVGLGELAGFVIDSRRHQKRTDLFRRIIRLAYTFQRFEELSLHLIRATWLGGAFGVLERVSSYFARNSMQILANSWF